MIKLLKAGRYKITETWGETRILTLDETSFAWVFAGKEIGEILVSTKKKFSSFYTLSKGVYRIYEVEKEKGLNKGLHLELCVGEGFWQGYFLPTGLPKEPDIRNKIVPTNQIITQTSNLRFV